MQTTYRKIAQPSMESIRPPKLIPPAMYKRFNTARSAASGMTPREFNYQTAHTSAITNPSAPTFRDFIPRPVATSTQRKVTTKRNLDQDQGETEEAPEVKDDIPERPRTKQRQALAEAISTAMSEGLEPLLAFKESKNKTTKYPGTRDGNAVGWMMLMKRHLQKAHAKAIPLDKA